MTTKILKEVLSIPTTTLHEHGVMEYIIRFCRKRRLKCKLDEVGNVHVRYKRGKGVEPVTFIAHMDHPGFEVVRSYGKDAMIAWRGRVDTKVICNSRIAVWRDGKKISGKILSRDIENKYDDVYEFKARFNKEVFIGDFGAFDLPSFQVKKGSVYTRAADDLLCVSVLLETLDKTIKGKLVADFTCVFTRAEEGGLTGVVSGFTGTRHVIEMSSVSKKNPVMVLECSSAKSGGISINSGPVIRVGDALSIYNRDIGLWLLALARAQNPKKFSFQRALLSGGRCEATLFDFYGYRTICLAMPLGNYHNNGGDKAAPEYVGVKDYQWMKYFILKIITSKYSNALKNDTMKVVDHFYKNVRSKRLMNDHGGFNV